MTITSFSRLESFVKCGEYYRYYYVDRNRPDVPLSEPLVKGKFVHSVIEGVLREHGEPLDLVQQYLPEWLEELNTPFEESELFDFLDRLGTMLTRASVRCPKGMAPIRNKDGSVPKDLTNYPPASWSQELRNAGLHVKRQQYDNNAAMYNPIFTRISFSTMMAEVVSLVSTFKIATWHGKTLGIELPFSTSEHNQVPMPGYEDLFINAYIDWVFETSDGRLVICDHKTSKEKPQPQAVQFHQQLNLYAYLYHRLYGRWPDILAIHHVPSGEYVMAQFDRAVMESALDYIKKLQQQVDRAAFSKHHPDQYNTPCLRKDYKTGEIVETCPYLEHCWPLYTDALKGLAKIA